MKLARLVGVIDRIVDGIVTVVPDDRSREVYLSLESLPEAREGQAVNLAIIPAASANGLARVFLRKPEKRAKAPKLENFASLLRAMKKSRDRLQASIRELEGQEPPPEEQLTELRRKRDFLDEGIELFLSRR